MQYKWVQPIQVQVAWPMSALHNTVHYFVRGGCMETCRNLLRINDKLWSSSFSLASQELSAGNLAVCKLSDCQMSCFDMWY